MGGGSGKLSYEKVDLTGKTAIVTGANGGEYLLGVLSHEIKVCNSGK